MTDVNNLKETRVSSDQWSEYWKQGHLTTFAGPEFEDGYQGSFKSFWLQYLDILPEESTIVDLGTGNGALPLLFARALEDTGRKVSIVGVDSASIEPSEEFKKYRKRDSLIKVRFKQDTLMEATKLKKGSTDLVVSQYGFEYGNQEQVLKEIRRILKPGGRLSLIVHHEGSFVVKKARGMLDQAILGEEERLVNRIKKWARDFSAGRPKPVLDKQAQQLDACFKRLNQSASRFNDANMLALLVNGGMAVATKVQTHPEEAKVMLQEWITEFNAYRLRMVDICSVAYSNKGVNSLIDLLRAEGFTNCGMSVINHENSSPMGIVITARI